MNFGQPEQEANVQRKVAKIFLWIAGIAAALAAASGIGVIFLYLNPFSLLFCDDPGICNSLAHISRFAVYQAVPFIVVGILCGLLFISSYFLYKRAQHISSISLSALLMVSVASTLYTPSVQRVLVSSRTVAAPLLGHPEVRYDRNNNENTPRFACPNGNTYLTIARGSELSLYDKTSNKAIQREFARKVGNRILWRINDGQLFMLPYQCTNTEGTSVIEYLNIAEGLLPSSFEIPGVAWIRPNSTVISTYQGKPLKISFTHKEKDWGVDIQFGDDAPERYDLDDIGLGIKMHGLWIDSMGIDAETKAIVLAITPIQSGSN